MKTAEYTLAGNVPESLRGVKIRTKEAETLDEGHQLVEDGKPENVLKLAQAQYDIIVQRKIRDAADSEEIGAILAGKSDVDIDGEKMDFSQASDDERKEYAVTRLQAVADGYTYGARPLISGGGSKAAKAALADKAKLAEAAKANPDLAKQLADLGISF